mgnify:FL=1
MNFRYKYFVFVIITLFSFKHINSQVVINEVCASNSSVIQDKDGEYNDWFEITNYGTDAVSLNGYCLRDDINNLSNWCFPDYNLQAGEHLILFASGKNLTTLPSDWKTIIKQGDKWKYILPSSNIQGWTENGYNDSSWTKGPSGIGYSDGDDATIIPSTIAVYMRKEFHIENKSQIEDAILHMDYDDGFVAYINDIEIVNKNTKLKVVVIYY